MAILTELRDPRVRDVTVTFVEVAPDMRSAKVHVSIMGNESRQNLSLKGLQNAAGFLQQRIADRIDTRYTPRLQFLLDKGVKNSIAISRILDEVLRPERPADGDATAERGEQPAIDIGNEPELDDEFADEEDEFADDAMDDEDDSN